MIAVQSGHVWVTVPPVDVDEERWTLVLWYVQEQGTNRSGTVSDGGRAIQEALSQVPGEENHQREAWHLFPVAAHAQRQRDRALKAEQAEREAKGPRPRGRRPKASLPKQKALLAQVSDVADGVRSRCQQLHPLWEVVVPCADRLLSRTQRQGEIEALLDVLDELAPSAPPALQGYMQLLSK